MKSYPSEQLSRRPTGVVAVSAGPRAVVEGCTDAAGGGQQPPFSYQPEGSYGRQLLWSLIATVLLAAIAAFAWLSVIGSTPGANEQAAARVEPANQSISAIAVANTKYDGRQEKWTSTA
jgi:hypothetical protein